MTCAMNAETEVHGACDAFKARPTSRLESVLLVQGLGSEVVANLVGRVPLRCSGSPSSMGRARAAQRAVASARAVSSHVRSALDAAEGRLWRVLLLRGQRGLRKATWQASLTDVQQVD